MVEPAEVAKTADGGELEIHQPRPCGASRLALRGAGWECTGVGLIVVMHFNAMKAGSPGRENLPVVLPRRALEIIDPEPWWELPIKDFTGGDHCHLVVPRHPSEV